MKKWSAKLITSSLVLSTFPYVSVGEVTQVNAEEIVQTSTSEQIEKMQNGSYEEKRNNEYQVTVAGEMAEDNMKKNVMKEAQIQEERVAESSEQVKEEGFEAKIKPRNTHDFSVTIDGITQVVPSNGDVYYVNGNNITFERLNPFDEFSVSYQYNIRFNGSLFLSTQPGNTIAIPTNVSEGIYRILIQGLDDGGVSDSGYVSNLVLRTKSDVNIDGTRNDPTNPVENPVRISVGRDVSDTYGTCSHVWEIRDELGNIVLSGSDRQPAKDEINSLPIGDYTISNTVTEFAPPEFGDYSEMDTTEGAFKISGGQVNTEHIILNSDGKESIYNTTSQTGRLGREYITSNIDIPGYELVVEKYPSNATGIFTITEQTVKYYYKKIKTKITTKYLDEDENTISNSDLQTGEYQDMYETAPKEIPGYELVATPSNAVGIYTTEDQTVIYIYKKKETDLKVQYIDENRKSIATEDTFVGKYQDSYFTKPKKIPGYELISTPKNANGKYTDEDQTVVYIYRKKEVKVTSVYKDENGKTLKHSETSSGEYKEPYTTKSKKIPGYTLTEIPVNANGVRGEKDIVVEYIYKKNPSKVIVLHVDKNGNPLVVTETKNGFYSNSYSTTSVDIPGYRLIKKPKNAGGNFAIGITEVIYVYELIPPKVKDTIEGSGKTTGTGTPGKQVVVTFPDGSIVIVDVDQNGNWIADVPVGLYLKTEDNIIAATFDKTNKTMSSEVFGDITPLIIRGDKLLDSKGSQNGSDINNSVESVRVNRSDIYTMPGIRHLKDKRMLPSTGSEKNGISSLGAVLFSLAGITFVWLRKKSN